MTVDDLKQTFIKAICDVTGMDLSWDNLSVSSIRSIDGSKTEATLVARESVPGNPNSIVGETTVMYERIDISTDNLIIDARDLFLGFKSEYRTRDVIEWVRSNTELDLPESEFVDDIVKVQQGSNAKFTLRAIEDSAYFIGTLQCEIVFPAMPYVDYTLFSENEFDLTIAGIGDIKNKVIIYVDGELFPGTVIPPGEHRVVIYGIDNRLEHTKIPAIKLHKLYLQDPTDIATVGFNTPILSPTIKEVDFKAIYSERAHLSGLFHGNPNAIALPTNLFEYLGSDIKTDGLFRNTGITSLENTLFSGVKLVTLVSAFDGCDKLVSIPAGLLVGQSELTSATSMFKGSGVAVLPNGLLNDCVKLTDISYMFAQSKLQVIQGPMGNGCGAVNANNIFTDCNIKDLPEDIFKGMSGLTSMVGAFARCSFVNLILTEKYFEDQKTLSDISDMFTSTTGIKGLVKTWINSPIGKMGDVFRQSDVEYIEGPIVKTNEKLNASGSFANCRSLLSVRGILFDSPNVTDITSLFQNNQHLTDLDYVFNPEETLTSLGTLTKAMYNTNITEFKDYWLGRRHTYRDVRAYELFHKTKCLRIGKTFDFGDLNVSLYASGFIKDNPNLQFLSDDLVVGSNTTTISDKQMCVCGYLPNFRITTGELINTFNIKRFLNTDRKEALFERLYWLDGDSTDIIERYNTTLNGVRSQNWFMYCFRLSDYFVNYSDVLIPNAFPALDLISQRGWETPIVLTHQPLPSPYDRDGFPWVPYYRTIGLQFSADELSKADTLEKRINLLGDKLDFDLSPYTWYTRPFVNLPYYSVKISGDVYSINPLPDEITEFKSTYFVIRRA